MVGPTNRPRKAKRGMAIECTGKMNKKTAQKKNANIVEDHVDII